MLFNSLSFLIFFPIVTLIYYIMPKKMRWIWLLITSYYFYMSWNPKYAILMGISTFITYLSGIGLNAINKKENLLRKLYYKKLVVAVSFITNIGILVFFKYFDFILNNLNTVLANWGLHALNKPFDVILPVGISFYTFQALSYTMDVYRGSMEAENNLFKYALFVSFFPQLVAGPIERSTHLLRQVNTVPLKKLFDCRRIMQGLVMMIWGLFLKMVIADRIAVLVNTVFNSYYLYHTFALAIGAISFAIQIYCDFASYSTIAIGAAKVLGFDLMENFNTPYLSASIREFWHRWHISLSTWFKDYLYIPLGGNRCSKWRKYLNTMITFLVSGLWHGANWTFIIWGGVHGLYQVIGQELKPIKAKINRRMHTKTESFSYKLGQIIITFVLVDLAWIFFRADTLNEAVNYIYRMFTTLDLWSFFNGTIYKLGLDLTEIHILLAALLVLFAVDMLKYLKKENLDAFLDKQCLWFQWVVLVVGISVILIYGEYGPAFNPQQFIYFQF